MRSLMGITGVFIWDNPKPYTLMGVLDLLTRVPPEPPSTVWSSGLGP